MSEAEVDSRVTVCARVKSEQQVRLNAVFEQLCHDERTLLLTFAELLVFPLSTTPYDAPVRDRMEELIKSVYRYINRR